MPACVVTRRNTARTTMVITGGDAADIDMETRLLGKLSLAPNERATAVLVARLNQAEILYSKNIINAPEVAESALAVYTASINLGSGLPLLVRVEGPNDGPQRRWRAIYTGHLGSYSTDGTYLFYADIEGDA